MRRTSALGGCAVIAVVVAMLVGCQPQPERTPQAPAGLTDADRSAIRQAGEQWVRSMKAADWNALAALYTSDAVLMPPNHPAVERSAEIPSFFAEFPPVPDFRLDQREIEGYGDMAWVRGTYTMTMAPPEASPIEDRGKYLEVWRKQADGSWKIHRDIFNSDVTPPAPAEMPVAPAPTS